jgi:hypothetical protein
VPTQERTETVRPARARPRHVQERDDRIDRQINVPQEAPGLTQNLAQWQLEELEVREEPFALLRGEVYATTPTCVSAQIWSSPRGCLRLGRSGPERH